MGISTEVETKLEIDERGYEAILAFGSVQRRAEQLNVYYDSDWNLASQGATFRIRISPRKAPLVTLKTPLGWLHGTRSAQEIEVEFRALSCPECGRLAFPRRLDVAKDLPDEFHRVMLELGIGALRRVGWVRNRRYEIRLEDVGIVELDRLKLPDGKAFFEAEFESNDPSDHGRFVEAIRRLVPSARESRLSKFERFRRAAAGGATPGMSSRAPGSA